MTRPVTLWRIAPAVFLPTLLFETGQGAITPIVALNARELGGSFGAAGLVLALLGLGQILGDVPAGALTARVGERTAMLIAAGVAATTLTGCLLARHVALLGLCVAATGMTNSVFNLARQAYLTEVVPGRLRARALSTLGGTARIGYFFGPFIGAAVLRGGVPAREAYWVAMVAAVAAGLVVLLVPDVTRGTHRPPGGGASIRSVLSGRRRMFATLGSAVLMVSAVRATRQTILPLWASHLGLSPATTSVVFGIAGAVDMLLFYPSGKVMDRFGRLPVAVPSMLILGLSQAALPLTRGVLSFAVVAVLMGFGNGIGSGILMTLGADVAPPGARSQFLGVWRLCADSGNAAGPLAVSAVAGLGSLAGGAVLMGGVGLAATAALIRWVPRYSRWAHPGTIARFADAPGPAESVTPRG
ncbi:MAG: MFS transporter [Actinocatenispora sp.]